jgi:hypothetical protein
VRLGVELAKVLARALRCHPAVLVFPGWDAHEQSAAYPRAAPGRAWSVTPFAGQRPRQPVARR